MALKFPERGGRYVVNVEFPGNWSANQNPMNSLEALFENLVTTSLLYKEFTKQTGT